MAVIREEKEVENKGTISIFFHDEIKREEVQLFPISFYWHMTFMISPAYSLCIVSMHLLVGYNRVQRIPMNNCSYKK